MNTIGLIQSVMQYPKAAIITHLITTGMYTRGCAKPQEPHYACRSVRDKVWKFCKHGSGCFAAIMCCQFIIIFSKGQFS